MRAKRAFEHLREVAAGPVVRAIMINRPPKDVLEVWHHGVDHPLRFLTRVTSSEEHSGFSDYGVVRFLPVAGGRGTVVRAELRHDLRAIATALFASGHDAHDLDDDIC